MTPICEACEREPATFLDPRDDEVNPYSVCGGCHARLLARSLRPLEWYNLTKRHGILFLLHDDFYTDDGVAMQPEDDVIDGERFPMPTLNQVRHDGESLLDWSITQWSLSRPLIEAWKRITDEEKLRVFSRRYSATSNAQIRSTIFSILGKVGNAHFAEFVCYAWAEAEFVVLGALAEASAKCLPSEEGISRVIQALDALEPTKRRNAMYCLGFFDSTAGLDWIESNFFEPASESWGYLAAMCRPSWSRMVSWLKSGRPLGLIAIDTLRAIEQLPTPLLRELDVLLEGAPDQSELEQTLRAYELLDPSRRVEQRIAWLLKNPERITSRLSS